MRATIYRRGGGSDVLEVTEIPAPEPGPGEVRVRIAVSGVNPTDPKSLRTAGRPDGGFAVPNQDGAGVIDAVGPGVSDERLGERVWLLMAARDRRWGTAAELSVVPAERAVVLPDGASFDLGASLGVPALTAWHCLSTDGPVRGQTVLVAGGAGAVGNMAIALARWAGAGQVIATVSSEPKAELARAAGADHVILYREADTAERIRTVAPDGVDRVVEVALDANLELDLEVAAPHAVICSYAATPETVARVPVRELMTGNLTLRFMLLYTIKPTQLRSAIDAVSAALDARVLRTLPLRRFSLAETAAAHDAVLSGTLGKVLIDVGGSST